MDFSKRVMYCEVVDNEDTESAHSSKDRMQRFNNQMLFIREGLQKSEAPVLPQYFVHQSFSHVVFIQFSSKHPVLVDDGILVYRVKSRYNRKRRADKGESMLPRGGWTDITAWSGEKSTTGEWKSVTKCWRFQNQGRNQQGSRRTKSTWTPSPRLER